MGRKQYVCIGSYSEPIFFGTGEVFQGKGKGVQIAVLENGNLTALTEAIIANPSYLCMDESHRKIYTVNEKKEFLGKRGGGITQLAYDGTGNMKVEAVYHTEGEDPCHVVMSADGSLLAVSNYSSGSLTVFRRRTDGCLTGEKRVYQHRGCGLIKSRQEGPHAHSTIVTPDGQYLYVCDLGIDQLKAYRLENGSVVPISEADVIVPAGTGPRIGEFSSDIRNLYLIGELGSQILWLEYYQGHVQLKNIYSTLPLAYQGENTCAELHITPDGQYLYASNRGHDSLACFRILSDGSLELSEIVPCGGRTPRSFAIDPNGQYVLVGNQDSDTISVFCIEKHGHLKLLQQYFCGSPVCVRFFEAFSEESY